MEIDYTAIGMRIQELRKEHGMKQKRLAKLAGVSEAHLSAVENGSTAFSLKLLMRLSEELGTTPGALLGMEVARRDRERQALMDKVDEALADCTKEQLSMLQKVVHSAKEALRQYDGECAQTDGEKYNAGRK